MQGAPGFSQSGLSWVCFGGLLLLGGRLSDLLGARGVFVAGWVILSSPSLLAGVAATAELEIAGGAQRGFGAALIAPLCAGTPLMGLVAHQPGELTKAFAVYGASAAKNDPARCR